MNLRLLPLRSALTVGLSLAIGLAATATPAYALKFTKLIQYGQTVPGNSQPVAGISGVTIGLDGQVAVSLSHARVDIPAGGYTEFRGIYSISKNGTIRLVAGDTFVDDPFYINDKYVGFSEPSISQGKIAYIASTGGSKIPSKTTLYVGQPGQVKPILDFAPLTKLPPYPNGVFTNLSFVNGKAYVLVPTADKPGLVGLVDTEAAKPILKVLNVNQFNASVSANSQQVLTTTLTEIRNQVFPPNYSSYTCTVSQSLGGGSFKLLATARQCGAAVSAGNAVYYATDVIDNQPPNSPNYYYVPKINVRFGQNGQFAPIPLPVDPLKIYPNTIEITGVSISQQTVIFQASVGRFDSPRRPTAHVDTLYLSQNGQAPTPIMAPGQTIDGKTVVFIGLATGRRFPGNVGSSRTIAGNSAVVSVGLADGTSALYRVDF
jgi:hypothetical protein